MHSTRPVIDPGLTFASVTDKISSIVLKRKTSLGVVLRLCDLVRTLPVDAADDHQPGFRRHRSVGRQHSRRLGRRHSQLRLVDRNRPRRHADFRNSACCCDNSWRTSINRFAEAMTLFAVAQAGMYPDLSPRPTVADVLAVSVSKHDGNLAAVSQPFDVGRVRGFDLRHRFGDVLVCRFDSRLRDAARSRAQQTVPDASTECWRWAGAVPHVTGIATRWLICCLRDWPRRSCFQCTRSSVSTSRSASFPVGTRRSFHRTSLPARSTPASRWFCC